MWKDSARAPDFSPMRGKRLLIALSGGADSVALAVMLADARAEYGLTLCAAHVDHGIRPESAEDAAFCRALCASLDIPFHSVRFDIPAEAEARRVGLETCARLMRYEWLRQCMAETRCDCIALAHHMDDQAETVLMRLARGAGPEGIGAMRTFAGDLYRPLLGLRKSELTAFLRARGIAWREDATNRVDDNPRNAIRLRVVPELEKCYPGFVPAAARFAESARIESDYLAEVTAQYLDGKSGAAPMLRWLNVSDPPHRALLRRAIRAVCPIALDGAQVEALEALCARPRGKLDLAANCVAERTGRHLYFAPKQRQAIPPAPFVPNGLTRLLPLCEIDAAPARPVPVRDDPLRQVLDADALRGAVLRTRCPGDRIRPLGCGEKSLSDYFIDKKVDRPLRDLVALVARGQDVLWVCGLGISETAMLTPATSRALALECRYAFDLSPLNE